MKLARVTGTVEASQKDASLSGAKLLLTDLVDGAGQTTTPAFVAVDSCGAGVGDTVLITFNGAARMPSGAAGAATDATIIAIVDRVSLAGAKPAKAAAAKATAKRASAKSTARSTAKPPKNSKASNRRKS